eukprot:TRINITY_DN1617_c0_g1_i4.p1 TRINITY_DN1617_c0_g1~~TRINITY_DN1617_c0_g1_i4.p1  ORF type:complete len:188 (-),score=20.38 TRINITY_DN1617_c0_g1_i4:529-1092(-)
MYLKNLERSNIAQKVIVNDLSRKLPRLRKAQKMLRNLVNLKHEIHHKKAKDWKSLHKISQGAIEVSKDVDVIAKEILHVLRNSENFSALGEAEITVIVRHLRRGELVDLGSFSRARVLEAEKMQQDIERLLDLFKSVKQKAMNLKRLVQDMACRQTKRASNVKNGVILKSLFAAATGLLAIATGVRV